MEDPLASSDSARLAPPPGAVLERRLGLYGATMVGVSAMLGAGIFVLSGVALRSAGPGALLAFFLNGLITTITAFSFAELATAFPESGGSYVFARKVFPMSGAFAVGWVLWLAYIVAGALYALGFSSFLGYVIEQGAGRLGHPVDLPAAFPVGAALALTVVAVILLARQGAAAGSGAALGKVVAFAILVLPGLALIPGSPEGSVSEGLSPLLPLGLGGVLVAMGYTFIALEGFEVIAAVGEEVRDPERTIPRAMFLSIGLTLAIYLGLLVVMLCLAAPAGGGPAWRDLGERGDQAVAVAVQRYLGGFGAAVVVVAGLLATFSALTSALLAASRVSFSMARDRALPRPLGRLAGSASAPLAALAASGIVAATLILAMGDVEVAGGTASIIFLLSFALVNGAGLLVRVRGGSQGGFKAPLYPFLPLVGVTVCVGLAGFQLFQEWRSLAVALAWLGLGATLYYAMFRTGAETVSARAEALDANLLRLRGREPLVLVPLANPERAETLTTFAAALAPDGVGRVLALAVAPHPDGASPAAGVDAYERSQAAMRRAVGASCRLGRPFEGVVVLAADVAGAVARTARERTPDVVLLGMSRLDEGGGTELLEQLLAQTRSDVVVLHAPPTWTPDQARRILVPVGGEAHHDPLRARVLGMLQARGAERIELLRVIRDEEKRPRAQALLERLAGALGEAPSSCAVVVSDDAMAELVVRSREADLIVLGLGRGGRGPLVGPFVRTLAREAACPLVAIGWSG